MRIRALIIASIVLIAGCLAMPVAAQAQTGNHVANLVWTASTDAGVSYNVYRASGVCASPLQTMTKLATVTTTTYQDSGLAPGTYCYYVTSTLNGAESVYSATGTNFQSGEAYPFAPTTLQVTVK